MPGFTYTVQQTSPGVFTNCCCEIMRAPLVINPWVAGPNGRPVHQYSGRMQFTDDFSGTTSTVYATAVAAMAAASPATGVFAGRYSTTYVTFHDGVNQTFDRFPSGAAYVDNTKLMVLRHAYEFPTVINPATGGAFYCSGLQTAGATVSDGQLYLLGDANANTSDSAVVKLVPYDNRDLQPQYLFRNNCTNYPIGGGGNSPVVVGSYLAIVRAERLLSLPDTTWHYVTGTAKQLCNLVYAGTGPTVRQQPLGPVLLPADPNYNNAAFWQAAFDAAVASGTIQPVSSGGYFTPGINVPVTVTEWAEK